MTRPFGYAGPTPDELWANRRPISTELRKTFEKTVKQFELDSLEELGYNVIDDNLMKLQNMYRYNLMIISLYFIFYSMPSFALAGEKKEAKNLNDIIKVNIEKLASKNQEIVDNASRKLISIGKPAVKQLVENLKDKSKDVRANIGIILGEIGEKTAITPMITNHRFSIKCKLSHRDA